jgi:tetratricopeptide (TPR) repeat protein
VTESNPLSNPFPGLRPFEPDEDHLFFGREEEVDELLRRLRTTRFLAVVGTSGCGKSSLVRSGLIPSLHGGFMVKPGSNWRVAILRPGGDPIGNLAAALDSAHVIAPPVAELASTNRVLLDAALRRGTRGLIEAVRQADMPPGDNVLIVVDQFEELFRFRRGAPTDQQRDEATAFVKLLLEVTGREQAPIYVVLTMRADFIGDCVEYPGLPEAMNASQYLVPRLTRDELRAAVMGPVAVGGGRIAPRLVVRLLNDIGHDQDQLPVLQHALMRTWDHWRATAAAGEPMDIAHYEAVGTLHDALSRHAEEAYREAGSEQSQRVVERVFKALTDTVSDPRGVRRPCRISELAAVAGAAEAEVIAVVESFRAPGRSFLMPPPDVPLASDTIVDLSHESLMRCWTRLISWAEDERASADVYLRLTRAAAWFDEGTAGLWRDPELELGLRWKRETAPSAAWAQRYDRSFDRAMRFLDRSAAARDREAADRAAARQRQWRQLQWTAVMLAGLLVLAVWNWLAARESSRLARANLDDAVAAVNESLALIGRDPERLGIDHPNVVAIRRELATKAREFYSRFIERGFENDELRHAIALAHFRLGQANRVLGDRRQAAMDYREAIADFTRLVEESPSEPLYRRDLANSFNFLGETLRTSRDTHKEARDAYDRALALFEELRAAHPDRTEYIQDLARARYNRGILLSEMPDGYAMSEADFRAAIALLEPLVERRAPGQPEHDLSRALNNLATLLFDPGRSPELMQDAERLYEAAVAALQPLAQREPGNREYQIELAAFYNNLSAVQRARGADAQAENSNARALTILEELAQPSPALGVDLADGHTLRARMVGERSPQLGLEEYEWALGIFERLAGDAEVRRREQFHRRFGELLEDLALFAGDNPGFDPARTLLARAVAVYVPVAEQIAASGTPGEATAALRSVSRLARSLSERDRAALLPSFEGLEARLVRAGGTREP